MNPVIVNCILLYCFVILLSLLQSRFRVYKDSPLTFVLLVTIFPFLVLGKIKGRIEWTSLTGIEIFAYTLMLAYTCARRIVPKVNEGFIYAYTLLHWYLLADAVGRVGLNFWNIVVGIGSILPTVLILKNAFQHRALYTWEKITLYYWFLFSVAYVFVSQFALHIIQPVLTAYDLSLLDTTIIFLSAVQLYFLATIFALLFVAIPLFHMQRGSTWKKAMQDWREVLHHKLDNYVEYQISPIQVLYITAASVLLFSLDASYASARPYTVIVYTLALPIIYFYLKSMPKENLENPFAIPEEQNRQASK